MTHQELLAKLAAIPEVEADEIDREMLEAISKETDGETIPHEQLIREMEGENRFIDKYHLLPATAKAALETIVDQMLSASNP